LRQARPVMAQVAKAANETTMITVLREGKAIALDAVEADQPVRVVARVGEPLPLHCTAVGKVHLAFADADLRTALPETLQKYTERTVVDRQALAQQLRKIAETGWALDLGEHVEDVRSVAVPIRDYTRTLVGSLALSGPGYRLSQDRIDKEVVPLMLRAGGELSTRLGFDGAQ
jgi:IclR family KDG regulon transcriptional repressor